MSVGDMHCKTFLKKDNDLRQCSFWSILIIKIINVIALSIERKLTFCYLCLFFYTYIYLVPEVNPGAKIKETVVLASEVFKKL